MATFVNVHGGWGGGWEWTEVARELRARGHEVFTPTLTGMGERHHINAEVRLATHIEDVVAVLEYEDLRDVVLTGQSYSGMVVTGAADRAADRVALLVHIDAFVPEAGEALIDLVPDMAESAKAAADERGHGWFSLPEEMLEELLPAGGLISAEKRDWYIARLRPHPVGTMTEPLRLSGAIDNVPRAFIRCTGADGEGGDRDIETSAARARAEGWLYRELPTPHDPQLFDPVATAMVLDELATTNTARYSSGVHSPSAARR